MCWDRTTPREAIFISPMVKIEKIHNFLNPIFFYIRGKAKVFQISQIQDQMMNEWFISKYQKVSESEK